MPHATPMMLGELSNRSCLTTGEVLFKGSSPGKQHMTFSFYYDHRVISSEPHVSTALQDPCYVYGNVGGYTLYGNQHGSMVFSQISEQRLTRHVIIPFDGASRASRTGRGAGGDDRMAGFHLPHDGEVGDDAAGARAGVDCRVP